MSGPIGKPERATQNRVVKLFRDQLGYRYLGDWQDRSSNSNIDADMLAANLRSRGYSEVLISRAIERLKEISRQPQKNLYERNQNVWSKLRYGLKLKEAASDNYDDVELIDWDNLERNDFAIAEEVTLREGDSYERRPDIVLYINGIAVGVIELKSSRVSIGDGIRQLLSNQQPQFNEWFFSTVQYCFAGSDSEGLKYGTIKTPETFFLNWKEDEDDADGYRLDKYLLRLCRKERLLELIKDFVLFDAGRKKVPRHNQYFGIKAAQEKLKADEGGIIWHTQGSGKSITMILLARWILSNIEDSRVVVITDREKLDKQIVKNFQNAGEQIARAKSGRDLLTKLEAPSPSMIASLVHKFGRRDVDDVDEFMKGLEDEPFKPHGKLFVFVDECHRTQSGKLHRLMKGMMPEAVFIGFTGTPLLKADKASIEVFGKYIHTYKHNEAVEDKVVLDVAYEARDIDQRISNPAAIDKYFEAKTKNLNEWQTNELTSRWATLKEVLSSFERQNRIVTDIIMDFSLKPRLLSGQGNAILVASSIYEACRYYKLFQETELSGRCAVVTSYDPKASDVSKEDVGANTESEKEFVFNTYTELLKEIEPQPGKSKTETYEDRVTDLFVTQPENMKLLVVVDKLLTGFDAPPCSVLYIDKGMQDHGLFQAITRTNRIDTEDKQVGLIIDYKQLFKQVEEAIAVYTSELEGHGTDDDPQIHMQNRLEKGTEALKDAREAWRLLIEDVPEPKQELQFQRHFCGNPEKEEDLADHYPLRVALYKAVASYVRAFANLADDMSQAGFSTSQVDEMKKELDQAVWIRDMIRNAAGETLDFKPFEADMRFLIDRFISADAPRRISDFENVPLVDLIVKTGVADAIAERFGQRRMSQDAIAESVENNIRATLIREHLHDPAFFERMSELLNEVIEFRRENAERYEEYLQKIAELAKKISSLGADAGLPASINTRGLKALYNNLNDDEALALELHEIMKTKVPEGFRGSTAKENMVKAELLKVLGNTQEVERLFLIIQNQAEYQ